MRQLDYLGPLREQHIELRQQAVEPVERLGEPLCCGDKIALPSPALGSACGASRCRGRIAARRRVRGEFRGVPMQRLVKLLSGWARHAILAEKMRRHPKRCRRQSYREETMCHADTPSASRGRVERPAKPGNPMAVTPPPLLPLRLAGRIVGWIRARGAACPKDDERDIRRPRW